MPALLSLLVLDPRLRKGRRWLALALYMAILVLGSVRGARAELGNYAGGILLHSLAYGGLTLLLFTGTLGTPRQRAVKAVLTVVAMGALDELIQSFLPFRAGSVRDWLVDCAAALMTALLLVGFLPAPDHSR